MRIESTHVFVKYCNFIFELKSGTIMQVPNQDQVQFFESGNGNNTYNSIMYL